MLVCNTINFAIVGTCSSIDTDNEAIPIFLKGWLISTSISTIYILPASLINTTLLSNVKTSVDNVIITWNLNAKCTDINCSEMDQWGIVLKKALNDVDLFLAENNDDSAIALNFTTKINKTITKSSFIIKLTGILSTLLFLTSQLFFKTKFLILISKLIREIQILSNSLTTQPTSSQKLSWTFAAIFLKKLPNQKLALHLTSNSLSNKKK